MRIVSMVLMLLAASVAAAADLGDLDWLEGHWIRDRKEGTIHERWERAANGVMRGDSWMTREGSEDRLPIELLSILQLGTDVYYIAHPRENAYPTAFRLIEAGERRAVFENVEHDFPQRILYERQDDDELLAAIEGPDGEGGTRRVEFPFRRAAD